MALAQYRKVGKRQGAGRFVVSEGVAPSAYLLPHEGLPTLYTDLEDDRFEIVITKGTILGLVRDNETGASRVVPCGYAAGDLGEWEEEGATAANIYDVDATNVATPIGCAQYDLYRPFDKGTSQGAGWITYGYVEWPMIEGLNDDVLPGSTIVSDALGRPVLGAPGDDVHRVVGKVIETETFDLNFDDGMLSYMQLPSDPGALKHVYELTEEGPYKGRLGIRANLNREGVVGAFRVALTL